MLKILHTNISLRKDYNSFNSAQSQVFRVDYCDKSNKDLNKSTQSPVVESVLKMVIQFGEYIDSKNTNVVF